MYLVRQARVNSVDPDKMQQNISSGSTLLPHIQLILNTILGSKLYLFKF